MRSRCDDTRHLDRYALLLCVDTWVLPDLDRALIDGLMRWWVPQTSAPTWVWGQCWYCGTTKRSRARGFCLDHAFPAWYNHTPLVPCCLHCNAQKRHHTPQEYRRFRRDGVFWFEHGGWAASPLGCALREDIAGLRAMLACYLIEKGQQNT